MSKYKDTFANGNGKVIANVNGAFVSINFVTSIDAYIDFRLEAAKNKTTQCNQLRTIFEEWHRKRIATRTSMKLGDDQFIPIPCKKKQVDRRNKGRKASKQTIRSLLETVIPSDNICSYRVDGDKS